MPLQGWDDGCSSAAVLQLSRLAFCARDRLSCCSFFPLLLQGWGDVYFFCGLQMEYCTCNFKWNLQGYAKGLSLFNFVLSAALVLQKLIIHVGLGGLLPGGLQRLALSCRRQGVGLGSDV